MTEKDVKSHVIHHHPRHIMSLILWYRTIYLCHWLCDALPCHAINVLMSWYSMPLNLWCWAMFSPIVPSVPVETIWNQHWFNVRRWSTKLFFQFKHCVPIELLLQYTFSGSNIDGSFTTAVSNLFLSSFGKITATDLELFLESPEAILMRTHNIPLRYRKSKRYPYYAFWHDAMINTH